MVAPRQKRIADALEDPAAIVHNSRCLAVHRHPGPADRTPVHHADRLVSQTDAENGCRRAETADDVKRDPCVLWPAWPRRDDDSFGAHRHDLINRDLIVAVHANLRTKLTQVLHEVVCE